MFVADNWVEFAESPDLIKLLTSFGAISINYSTCIERVYCPRHILSIGKTKYSAPFPQFGCSYATLHAELYAIALTALVISQRRCLFGHTGSQMPNLVYRQSLAVLYTPKCMRSAHQPAERDVDQREFQLTLFACLAIFILAIGLAVLMYPAVFTSHTSATANRTPEIAFYGFCGLSCLLVAYLVDRQLIIQKLRREIAAGRAQMKEKLTQASADLLETVPTFNAFEDRLTMEFRRAVTTRQFLSVFVIAIKLHPEFSQSEMATCALSDATKAVSHKLREQDSIYVLRFGFLGIILPGIDTATALRVSNRLSIGLSEAADAGDRFDFEIYATNYPEQVRSLHELEQRVCEHLPEAGLGLSVNYATQKVER